MKYTITVKKNKDFQSAYKRGGYTAGKAVVVYYRRNGRGKNRLGITTGKKSGNAVMRSRCRRIIRAAFRECEELFPKGFDYIIVARSGCADFKSTQISGFLKNKVIPSVERYSQNNSHGNKSKGKQ